MTPPGRRAALLTLAVAAAVLQLAASLHLGASLGHLAVLALAWAGALWLAYERRERVERGGVLTDVVGSFAWAAAVVAPFLVREPLGPVQRVLPIAAGVALAVLSGGIRGIPRRGRELLVLSLPCFEPIPAAIRAIDASRAAAWAASLFLEMSGLPVRLEGSQLALPHATLEVLPSCAGLGLVVRLLVIAILVIAMFPATWWQRALVVGTAAAVAFGASAARLAFLAAVAELRPDEFDEWHARHGYSVVCLVMAGAIWVGILRSRHRPVQAPRAPTSTDSSALPMSTPLG